MTMQQTRHIQLALRVYTNMDEYRIDTLKTAAKILRNATGQRLKAMALYAEIERREQL